jgi:alpha-tubulin suppressor-like RCC1 family protein
LSTALFGNSSISIVSTGGSHTVVVTEDKKVYTFGRNQRYKITCLIYILVDN